MKIQPPSLPLQLLVFVVLPLLVLLMVVAFGGVALHQAAMRDMLVNHNDQVVAGAASGLSEQLAQRRAVLSDLDLAGADPQSAQALVEGSGWLGALFDGGVAIFSADGRLLAASSPGAGWSALGQQITSQAPFAFVPLVEPGQNATRLAIAVAAGGLRAVGVVSLDALPFSSILTSLHESASTTVYLLGADGVVLYHSDPRHVGEHWAAAVPGTAPVERAAGEGSDVVATVAQIPEAQWTLVQEERWQETLSPVLRYSQAAPLALVPGLLIAMGAMWFGIRRIVVPLRRLEAQATELAWGDFAAIEQQAGGINEIRHLQATLQQMARRVQAAQVSMHDYIGAITHAQEEERQRLARELHDQTTQALIALDHRQQMLKPYLTDDPAAAELLVGIRAMIAQTIEDLRRMVRALRPVYLETLGLVPALQMLARDLELDESVAIHFEKTGSARRLAPEHEIALYRITQEALNNARRHSGASQVWLSVHFGEKQITVSVRDNGKGFSPPHHAAELGEGGAKHFGIMGMHERAALIGAHLQVQSEPGAGTTVTVRTPIVTAPE
ncbi:MAG: HAMP domain-containing protein [Chloroflexota bacterium]|jgi:signal transduction histidine kinase